VWPHVTNAITLQIGSDGHVLSELPPRINEVEIEATTTQIPSSKTVAKATLDLTAQGTAYNLFVTIY